MYWSCPTSSTSTARSSLLAASWTERRRLYTESARRAVHICAISEFTRQTLIERLGIVPERVTTTHLAADPIFEPGARRAATTGVC